MCPARERAILSLHLASSLAQQGIRIAGDTDVALGEHPDVLGLLLAILGALRSAFRSRASLVAENLALRQQLAVLRREDETAAADAASIARSGLCFPASGRDGRRR